MLRASVFSRMWSPLWFWLKRSFNCFADTSIALSTVFSIKKGLFWNFSNRSDAVFFSAFWRLCFARYLLRQSKTCSSEYKVPGEFSRVFYRTGKLMIFLFSFTQDNQVGDDRGAQHSHSDSAYSQWSSVSSSSSKSSFRPSSSSASGGVFGSTARNDRTSALKAAFQVFIFHLSLS